jgi:hypothetical protein
VLKLAQRIKSISMRCCIQSLVLRVPLWAIACLILHWPLLGVLRFRGHDALWMLTSAYSWSRLECCLWNFERQNNSHETMKLENIIIFFTITRCVRRIWGLPSGDDISFVGMTHCSINSLSERASEGWLTERCSDERWSL